MIVDVAAIPTRKSKEVGATERMIERLEGRFAPKPNCVAGDVAHGTGETLGWLITRKIEPHIPLWERPRRREDRLSRDDFTYDATRDVYVCPQGHAMKTNGRLHDGTSLHYRASSLDCRHCPLMTRCCPMEPQRRIDRDINEAARDYTRNLMESEAYRQSGRRRKKIEILFAELKHNLGLTGLRLRGLKGARDEFLLAATVQNHKRLIRHAAIPPPPRPALA